MPAAAAALSPALSAVLTGAVVLSGSGLICFSKDALPNDALYSVKTSITEPVRAGLAITPGAQARVSTHLADERLLEGEQLAIQAELTPNLAAALVDDFGVQVNDAERNLARLSDMNPKAAADAALELERMLNGHADHIAGLRIQSDGEVRAGLDRMEAEVRAEASDAHDLRIALDTKAGVEGTAAETQSLRASAKADVAAARARLAEQRASLGSRLTADVNAQLDAADRLILLGEANADAGADAAAGDLFRTAAGVASNASFLADALINLRPQTDEQAAAVISSVKTTGNAAMDTTVGGSGSTTNGSVDGSASGSTSDSLDLSPILDVNGNGVVDLDAGGGIRL